MGSPAIFSVVTASEVTSSTAPSPQAWDHPMMETSLRVSAVKIAPIAKSNTMLSIIAPQVILITIISIRFAQLTTLHAVPKKCTN